MPQVTAIHTPLSKSLAHLFPSVSHLSLVVISAVHPLSRASFSPIGLLKLSQPITSTLSLPFSPFLLLSLYLSRSPSLAFEPGSLNQQHQCKWTRGIWPFTSELPISLAAKGALGRS